MDEDIAGRWAAERWWLTESKMSPQMTSESRTSKWLGFTDTGR